MLSDRELTRRHRALRQAMTAAGYGALVIAGNAESMQRGYVRYVCDWRLWMGMGYAVLPIDDGPILAVGGGSQSFWARAAGCRLAEGVGSSTIDRAIGALRKRGLSQSAIGVVGMNQIMPHEDVRALRSSLPEAQFEDATPVMEDIMAIKSDEEISLAADSYRCVARALGQLKQVLGPGKTEREVIAPITGLLARMGCVDGIAHLSTQAAPYIRPPTDRQIQEDDTIKVQLEFAGPSGYWVELSDVFSFREPPDLQQRHFATTIRAMDQVKANLRPGVNSGDLFRLAEQTYAADGWSIADPIIWGFHGIGLSIVEPPMWSAASHIDIKEGMVLMVSTSAFVKEHPWSFFCPENLVVTRDGGRPLAEHSRKWQVLSSQYRGV